MSTTFSNFSDTDLLLTKESYKSLQSKFKVDRLCLAVVPENHEMVERYTEGVNRLITLLDAIEIEIFKREIYVQG